MAAGLSEDILLRILSESSQARKDIENLRQNFVGALHDMERAAKLPTFSATSKEAQVLRASVQAAAQAFVIGLDRAAKESRTLEKAISKVRPQVKDLKDEVDKFGKSGVGGVSALSGAFVTLRNALASVGIFLGARQIVHLGEDAVQSAIKLEALRAQITAAGGDAETGGRLFNFAREQAVRLGFDLGVVAESTARFTAATKNLNITEEQRLEVLRRTLEAARVNQLSSERLNFTLLALEQIASKGTVSLEELRRQLGDNLPGAVAILAKQLDVSIPKLFQMIEAGEVLADEALPALAKGFAETFGKNLPTVLDTAQRKVGTLKTLLFELKALVGEGILKEFSKELDDAGPQLDNLKDRARDLGKAVGGTSREVVTLTTDIATLAGTLADKDGLNDLFAFLIGNLLVLGKQLRIFSADDVDDTVKTLQVLIEGLDLSVEGMTEFDRATKEAAEETRKAEESAKRLADIHEQIESKLRLSAEAQKEYQERLLGSREEVDKQSTSILNLVASLDAVGGATATQVDNIKKEIKKVLDAFDLLGEAVPEQIQGLADRFEVVSSAAEDTAKSIKKVTDAILGGDREQVVAQTEALVAAVEKLRESTQSLSTEQVENLRDEIQKLLDAYGALGEDPPAALRALADEFEVTTSAVEKAAERQVKALEKLTESFGKVIRDLAPKTKGGVDATAKELAKLEEEFAELSDLPGLDPEQLERFNQLNDLLPDMRDEVAKTTEEFQKGIVPVEQVDKAIQNLIDSNIEGFANLDSDTRAVITNLLGRLQSVAQQGFATGDTVRGVFEDVADTLDLAGVNTSDLRDELELASGEGLDLNRVFENLERSIEKTGKRQADLRKETEESRRNFEEQAKAAEETATRIEGAAKKSAEAWGPLNDELERTVELCREVEACMSRLGGGAAEAA